MTRTSLLFLDIDSTLLDVSPRNQAILRHLATRPDIFDEASCQKLAASQCRTGEWGLGPALDRVQFPQAHRKRVELEWESLFFTDQFLHCDQPIPGSREFCHRAIANGAKIIYLTGRHAQTMGLRTRELLVKDLGFPNPFGERRVAVRSEGSQLAPAETGGWQFKVDPLEPDAAFKARVIQTWAAQVARDQTRLHFIDNEPVNTNAALALGLPNLTVYGFETCHSGAEEFHEKTLLFDRFEDFEFR